MTSKSTTKKTTAKKTSSKPNKALELLLDNFVWIFHEDNFKGRDHVSILNVSDSNKDEEWLRENGFKKVKTISPNNIDKLPQERDYDIAILMYLNKYLKDEEDLLYEIGERLHLSGAQFIAVTHKSEIDLEVNIIEETKTFKIFTC